MPTKYRLYRQITVLIAGFINTVELRIGHADSTGEWLDSFSALKKQLDVVAQL